MPGIMRSATLKLWIMYLILAGGLGLPFAENVMDLARWAWKKFWPGEDPEVELRKTLKELGADPNLILHGVSHDVGGFDLSGSLGLGRLLPGTALLGRNYRNANEMVGATTMGLAGPAGSFLGATVKAVQAGLDGEPLEAAKAFPGAVGAVAKAVDAHIAQTNRPTYGVTTKSGVRMTLDPKTGEYRDLTTSELVGQAMGFPPTLVKDNREEQFRVTTEILYWQIRRSDLLDKYRQAVTSHDEGAREAVNEDIQQFNNDAPSLKLRITGKVKAESLRAWKKGVQVEERMGARAKMYRGVVEGVKEAY